MLGRGHSTGGRKKAGYRYGTVGGEGGGEGWGEVESGVCLAQFQTPQKVISCFWYIAPLMLLPGPRHCVLRVHCQAFLFFFLASAQDYRTLIPRLSLRSLRARPPPPCSLPPLFLPVPSSPCLFFACCLCMLGGCKSNATTNNSNLNQNNGLRQMSRKEGHTSVVGDVAWHQQNPKLLGSVGDDKQLLFWDTSMDGSKPTTVISEVSGGVFFFFSEQRHSLTPFSNS